jgi:hypothetical protein
MGVRRWVALGLPGAVALGLMVVAGVGTGCGARRGPPSFLEKVDKPVSELPPEQQRPLGVYEAHVDLAEAGVTRSRRSLETAERASDSARASVEAAKAYLAHNAPPDLPPGGRTEPGMAPPESGPYTATEGPGQQALRAARLAEGRAQATVAYARAAHEAWEARLRLARWERDVLRARVIVENSVGYRLDQQRAEQELGNAQQLYRVARARALAARTGVQGLATNELAPLPTF